MESAGGACAESPKGRGGKRQLMSRFRVVVGLTPQHPAALGAKVCILKLQLPTTCLMEHTGMYRCAKSLPSRLHLPPDSCASGGHERTLRDPLPAKTELTSAYIGIRAAGTLCSGREGVRTGSSLRRRSTRPSPPPHRNRGDQANMCWPHQRLLSTLQQIRAAGSTGAATAPKIHWACYNTSQLRYTT